jgi:glutaconate CoA-transferase subunit A
MSRNAPTDKTREPHDIVAELRDGMTIGIGGWGARRKPMTLVREICRSDVRDLTVVSYGGPDIGLLCASGKVRKLIYGFVSLDVIALDPHFRRAREHGEIETFEIDEGMLQWGLYAAALRLPFLPTRAGLGTDVQRRYPELRTVRSPYSDGEVLMAMPALELDLALVHVNRADAGGNAQVLGVDPYFDERFCMAAKRRVVSCERIVSTEELTAGGSLQTLLLHRGLVDAVVETRFGAHPASCAPDYGIDTAHLREYVAATEPEAWAAYRERFLSGGPEHYLAAVGGEEHVGGVPVTAF